MTVVRINVITVPQGGAEELARRFAERVGSSYLAWCMRLAWVQTA